MSQPIDGVSSRGATFRLFVGVCGGESSGTLSWDSAAVPTKRGHFLLLGFFGEGSFVERGFDDLLGGSALEAGFWVWNVPPVASLAYSMKL